MKPVFKQSQAWIQYCPQIIFISSRYFVIYQITLSFLILNLGPNRTPQEDAFNQVIASVRQIVECVIHRIKIFGVIGGKGRFACDVSKHASVFNVCCQITNISMDRSPVWLQPNFYLRDLK